jgi:hypothetical protein
VNLLLAGLEGRRHQDCVTATEDCANQAA